MMLLSCLVVTTLTLTAAHAAHAQAIKELSAEQVATISAGRQVFLTWDVSGSPWPRACVYQYIDAMPEEATAVFTNYERHLTFIPNLRKATISRVIDPATAEVDYTLRVPIVADEDYTVRDHLSSYDAGRSYKVDWTLVRASSTKATEGSVRFEPHRSERLQADGTLMAYCNLVAPGSRLASLGFIKSRAMAQVREAARAIVVEVERERASNRALLDAQVKALRAMLAPASCTRCEVVAKPSR